jgi:hypothetical protein
MAGRTAYDRIWLATAGAVDRDRLDRLTAALKHASGDGALEIRTVAMEHLPDLPPPEHAVAPSRVAMLVVLGDLSHTPPLQCAHLNTILDFVRLDCARRRWPLEVIDLYSEGDTFVTLPRRPMTVLPSTVPAALIDALAQQLIGRLFAPLMQQRSQPPRRPEPMRQPAPAERGPPPATRGIESAETASIEPVRASSTAEPEPVRLGASAPSQVVQGSEFSVRFVAYPPGDETEVARLLTELSARSEHRLNVHECQWQRGTVVTVRVSARQVEITPSEQTFTWDGRRALLDFDATVANDATEGVVVLKLDVAVDGIVIARLRLDLAIVRAADTARPPLATVASEPARSAFASYSSKDRERVLDRLAAVRIATGLDVFLDCLSLNPGEQWKPRLEREIKGRDLFLLFWSSESATSPWVEWEWRTALTEKGRDAMQVHPLATGVKPPQELKDLHFGDVYMLVREAQIARRAERG